MEAPFLEREGNPFRAHLRIGFRHRRLILLTFLGSLLAVLVLLQMDKPRYRSTVKLAVLEKALTDIIQDNIDTRIHLTIANQLDLLDSENFLRRVFRSLPINLRKKLSEQRKSPKDYLIEGLKWIMGLKTGSLTEEAQGVLHLGKVLSSSHRGGGVIQIQATLYSPEEAQIVAQTAAQEFMAINLEYLQRKMTTLKEFFRDQIRKSYEALKASEERLETYRRERGIPSTQGQSEQLSQRLNQVENTYVEVKTQRQLAEKRLQLIESKLAEIQQKIPSIRNIEKKIPRIQYLKKKLSDLQKERLSASSLYTRNHPKLVGINKQIEETIQELRRITQVNVSSPPGTALAGTAPAGTAEGDSSLISDALASIFSWQDLYIEKIFTEVEIASLQNKERGYLSLIRDYRQKLLYELPDKERGLFELLREVEINREAYRSLVRNRERLQLVEAERVGNVQILEPANLPLAPVRSRRGLKLAFGGLLGIALGIGLAYLREMMNPCLNTIEAVEERTGLRVVGAIVDEKTLRGLTLWRRLTPAGRQALAKGAKVLSYQHPDSLMAENFRALATHLEISLIGQEGAYDPRAQHLNRQSLAHLSVEGRVVLITSPGPGEGKSTVVANLGVALAKKGFYTILLDADLHRPSLHGFFDNPDNSRKEGLAELVTDWRLLEEFLTALPREAGRLNLITSGQRPRKAEPFSNSQALVRLFQALRQHYRYILIDTPPVITIADALALIPYVDGVLLVIQAGQTQERAIARAKEILEAAGAKILGVVLNRLNIKEAYGPRDYYKQYLRTYYKNYQKNHAV